MSDEHDIDGVCLIERLQRPRKVIDGELPDGTPIKIRLLTDTERQVAKSRARARMSELKLDGGANIIDAGEYEEEYQNELAWQLLAFALRDPRVKGRGKHAYPVPVAWTEDPKTHQKEPDAGQLRDFLDKAEASKLLDAYTDFEESQNPDEEKLTPEQADAIVLGIKKNDEASLVALGARTLSRFLLTTASPQSISPTGRSSSGLDSKTAVSS